MRKRVVPKRRKRGLIIIFLLGLGITLFPIVSQTMYYFASRVVVTEFEKNASHISTKDVDKRIALAKAYNETRIQKVWIQDPFTDLQKDGIKEYARMLEINEQIGYLRIPKLLEEIPIYAGTSENVLQKGVGHLELTSLPVGGESTHTVLSAHRGLPTAKLFTDLDKMEIGDMFYIRNIKEILAYRVFQVKVVEPTDLGAIAIQTGKDCATLLTCTPYMINSHRLLVMGERVPYVEQEQTLQTNQYQTLWLYRWLFYLALSGVVILSGIIIRMRKKGRLSREKN
ncbi:class C sortase [Carnobacteriaceae bacterium zg-ZUI78]|nr:class C sortase [Carnobacteriaceae bacterium zg-ZUI78]